MTLKKKREDDKEKVKNLGGTKKYVTNRTGGSTTTTTKSTSGKTKAQLKAKANIKKYGGTASAAAANKAAMKLKIKKAYLDKNKKKK